MARHRAQDSAVSDYTAQIRYRLTVSLGRRRWGRTPAAAVEEQQARVQWQRPNDLRVDVIGRRFRTRNEGLQLSSVFDRPWFVPRSVDDSVRLFSDDFPATGALHPLAANGAEWYHYDLADSLFMTPPTGRRLRLYLVEVTPQRIGPALVVGRLWLDSETAEVVRFTFRYVGTGLFARPDKGTARDSATARRINSVANSIISLDADLEYGIQEGRLWMPYRQTLAGRVRVPLVGDLVIPFEAVTTFHDYEINTGAPIAFEVPLADSGLSTDPDSVRRRRAARRDSLQEARRDDREGRDEEQRAWDYAGRWPGGRYEIHRPPNDSLAAYQGWTDSLVLAGNVEDERRIREAQADLAYIAEGLPGELTGRRAHGIGFERPTDALLYNRVQGVSLGAGYRVRLPGRFADLFGTVRYGFSDERITARLAAVRDAPDGRLSLAVYRDLMDTDPISSGRTLANSANALFVAHDYADYHLAEGATASFETPLGTGLDLRVRARAERQRSVSSEAKSGVNDLLGGTGLFPENAPITEGTFGGGDLRLTGIGAIGWSLTLDGLAGAGEASGRIFGAARHSLGGARGVALRVQAGVGTALRLEQMAFRLGGPATVRGFAYGVQRGQAFWSAQADYSPLGGSFRPVLFLDAGRAGPAGALFDEDVLVGGGIGLSIYSRLLHTSLIRFDLSRPVSESGKWRFDLAFQAVR
jgi:hypothetical protein